MITVVIIITRVTRVIKSRDYLVKCGLGQSWQVERTG